MVQQALIFAAQQKHLSHSNYGVGSCGPTPFLCKKEACMALSVKTKEHIRRRAAVLGPKWGALLGGAAAAAVPRVGRNDPCPCGSGKKYKQCHGALS